MWLPLGPKEDVHRGPETLEKHELPTFPRCGQADTLNMTKRVSYRALLENAPEWLRECVPNPVYVHLSTLHTRLMSWVPRLFPIHNPHPVFRCAFTFNCHFLKKVTFFCLCLSS